jgi:hypothetical protein
VNAIAWRKAEVGNFKELPGRVCPASYRYSPRVFDREPEIVADTLYVVGGLYGNVEALDALVNLAARERGGVTIVFNGDYHWFDAAPDDFRAIESGVRYHRAIRGNVETEIANDDPAAGCGCAYPLDVSDAEVFRSNEILERLRGTAIECGIDRAQLASLPMHLVARVGPTRVGIVHGDAASLAGWGFAHDRLDDPSHFRWIDSAFRGSRIDVFASSHTCLPALRRFEHACGEGVIANNGAAGMPNFHDTDFGVFTRISRTPSREPLFALELGGTHVEALRLPYDRARWIDRFLASWPAGSPAHASYFRRITQGPRFTSAQAAPRQIVLG